MKAKQRSTTDQKPNAWIVNPKDRGRKAIKTDNKVYLQDGQEFQIELFNPLKESVLAEIKINGKPASSTGLIIRPGERFYLDCFVDDKKKFIFKTYTIEDTQESKEATSNNGLVEVFFYKEETLNLNNWRDKFTPVIEKHYHHYHPWYRPYYPWWDGYWYGSGCTVNYTGGLTNTIGSYTTTNLSLNSYSISSNLGSFGNSLGSYTSGSTLTSGNTLNSNSGNTLNCKSNQSNQDLRSLLNQNLRSTPINSLKTGRIEKGEDSSQKFEEVYMQFEKLHIASVVYQLLPESQKPIETKEIKSNESVNKDSIIELIKKLKDLHDSGILTNEEFDNKKAELLSRI
jgi:Short C-terminal domain